MTSTAEGLGIEGARPALVRLAQPAVQRFGKSPLRTLLRCEVQRHDERRNAAVQGATARLQPAIDALEVSLVRVFLRRYITYCARRRRFAAMNGAARLYTEVRA